MMITDILIIARESSESAGMVAEASAVQKDLMVMVVDSAQSLNQMMSELKDEIEKIR